MSAATKITFTPFQRVHDVTVAKPITESWERFVERLGKHERKSRKEDVPGWAPTLFRPTCSCGDEKCPGDRGHRIEPNALEVYALVLDLDKRSDGTWLDEDSAKNALHVLAQRGLQHAVHTTFNHRPPEHVSLRVVVALSRPVLARDWPVFWEAAVKHLGIHVESSCRNPDRFWYLPSVSNTVTTSGSVEPWSKVIDGRPLDVDSIMSIAEAKARTNSKNKKTRTSHTTKPGAFDIFDFMATHYPGAKRYENRGKTCWDIECPWESEHSSSSHRDTVVSFGNDGPGFSCLHDHCKGVRQWTEFRKYHQPEWVPFDERTHSEPRSSAAANDNAKVANITSAETEPEPLRRALPPPAPYPVDALGPLLGAAAKALHETVQAPLALCGQSVLAAASLAVQPHADVVIHGRRYPLTLWALTIAESGERKSAADKIALSPHTKHERERIEHCEAEHHEHTARIAAHEVAMAQAKKTKGGIAEITEAIRAVGAPPPPPPSGILICREPTIEAAQKLYLRGAPSLGLYTDEGAVFFGGYSMNSDNMLRSIGALCKLWDDGTSERIRSGDGASKIYGRRLAMHMLVQPVVAERVLGNELLAGQGFLARCLLVWPDTMAGTRLYREANPWDDIRVRGYFARMSELLETPPRLHAERAGELDPRELGLSLEAKETWREAYNLIEKQIAPNGAYAQIRPWASKAAEQILRIAGVLTIAGNATAPQIEASTIMAASKLVAWHLGEALRVVDVASVPANVKRAEAVLKWCRDKQCTLVHSRQLQNRGPNCVRDSDALTEAMDVLVRHGWAEALTNIVINGKTVRRAWRIREESQESQESQR